MVFSSFPVYLDDSSLQQQFQQPDDHQQGTGLENSQHPPPPPPPGGGAGGGVEGSIRPGSMVDRARLAKIPLPEAGLKCPRCDSTNTKFCYFNNYNLSQPRHFCKTCRRYWTRGGSLRNVPVGGGCRRNKRSKSSTKSSAKNERQMATNSHPISPSVGPSDFPQTSTQLPLMAALQNFNYYGFQPQMVATAGNGISDDMGFNNNLLSASQWKLPSSFSAGFDPTANLFPFQNEGGVETSSSMIGDHHELPSITTGISSVKMEQHQQQQQQQQQNQDSTNLSKHFLDASDSQQQWTGFSGLNSNYSTTHLL